MADRRSGTSARSSWRTDAGWVVTSHHNDILTFVGPSEVDPSEIDPDAEEVAVGLHGRSKRGRDAEQLRVLYVEDNRRNLQD
jgi:hypothetical protein